MLISSEDFAKVSSSPITGVGDIIDKVHAALDTGQGWSDSDYSVMLEFFAFTLELRASKVIEIPFPNFSISGLVDQDSSRIFEYLGALKKHIGGLKTQATLERLRENMRLGLGTQFAYEFTDGDLKRVNELVSELRELIAASSVLPPDHRDRLLKRLERFQSELHKRMGDLDKFFGLVGDFGVVLYKFGNDLKPMVDRAREIVAIGWRTQSAAEQLPSNLPPPQLEDESKIS